MMWRRMVIVSRVRGRQPAGRSGASSSVSCPGLSLRPLRLASHHAAGDSGAATRIQVPSRAVTVTGMSERSVLPLSGRRRRVPVGSPLWAGGWPCRSLAGLEGGVR
jgi:hypothetical protein